tara:strand:+ start:10092 stop:11882 length:1791 start_codon:yes stop_codon:yes gene_type:complete
MYIGSIQTREEDVMVLGTDGSFAAQPLNINPAFVKIFDEIISNSADEHRRNPKLNRIVVTVRNGSVTVADNGGIPVLMHEEYGEWIPELIFSNLKAGSNFDDSQARVVAGTNGVGSTLTNIYSLRFDVETCDGHKVFTQTYSNNMRERTDPVVTKASKGGYTAIRFVPDLSRFQMSEIDDDHVQILRKRCIDIAACNPGLSVVFNGEVYQYDSFESYCKLYTAHELLYDETDRWKVGITQSQGSFTHVSFVNAVHTWDGGTHVDYIASQVVDYLRSFLKKKHKIDLRPQEIKNHLHVFVQSDIVNPVFSSQTKEKLITEPRDFGSAFTLPPKALKYLTGTEMVQSILDWAQQKLQAEERKKLRKLNKKAAKGRVLKLIDAKARVGRDRCSLCIFEGDSAVSAFRKYRDPKFQGAFPLRGKFLNVSGMAASKVVANKEVMSLITSLGLQMGHPPDDLRYGRILIYADADPDGDSITGLLLNFFGRYWPELLHQGRIFRVQTPLVVVKRTSDTKWFYTNDDFVEWRDSLSARELSRWDIQYKKGLAALEDREYREIVTNPRMFSIAPGNQMRSVLDTWFGKSTSGRKRAILRNPGSEE